MRCVSSHFHTFPLPQLHLQRNNGVIHRGLWCAQAASGGAPGSDGVGAAAAQHWVLRTAAEDLALLASDAHSVANIVAGALLFSRALSVCAHCCMLNARFNVFQRSSVTQLNSL